MLLPKQVPFQFERFFLMQFILIPKLSSYWSLSFLCILVLRTYFMQVNFYYLIPFLFNEIKCWCGSVTRYLGCCLESKKYSLKAVKFWIEPFSRGLLRFAMHYLSIQIVATTVYLLRGSSTTRLLPLYCFVRFLPSLLLVDHFAGITVDRVSTHCRSSQLQPDL